MKNNNDKSWLVVISAHGRLRLPELQWDVYSKKCGTQLTIESSRKQSQYTGKDDMARAILVFNLSKLTSNLTLILTLLIHPGFSNIQMVVQEPQCSKGTLHVYIEPECRLTGSSRECRLENSFS
jgi:hypothetical protein